MGRDHEWLRTLAVKTETSRDVDQSLLDRDQPGYADSPSPKTTRESSEQWDATASPVVAPASGQTQVCFMVTRVWSQPFEI